MSRPIMVEQEQIQKKTFTNWVNAQLAKRRPPCMVVDLFNDFRDGSKLLELLEVMSGQRLSRERGRGMFQHRSNIEKALSFLRNKSIKLVNINIPDIINGKPSIVLGLIWTIILQYHIEELASGLSFSSRQSSMESLTSLDSRSTLSSRSATSSPVPPRGSPLHNRFKVSAKKALLLWVREQCHKAGCTLNVKDFKASWRSGVVFLAILYALRPDLVDLSKARTRSNKQNLEEAFCIAEKELRIPRLLDPDDVDVRDPDEKSIMTYVAQFLQYSRDLPAAEEETQATPDRKAKEVTCWLVQAYDELLEGWDSTDGESYSERYHVFHTFLVSFNEQRRPIMPLLTVMRRTPKLSEEQRALREAWDALTAKIREYKVELDMSLPAPLDTVARWLLKTEGALAEEEGEPQDHGRAADEAREKQELLRVCLEEMPQHLKTFQSFQNLDEYGNVMVPTDKMDELKRRFTGVRVSAKYHGIKLEYREHRHTVLDLLGQVRTKLRLWKRPYISPEAVRVLLQEWHELVNRQELTSLLEATLHKLKQVSEKYSSKSALSADYPHVRQQVKQLGEDAAVVLEEVTTSKSTMSRVLSAWDSYSDCLSSMQAWLEQGSVRHSQGHRPEVTSESIAEWGSRQAYLNEVGNFLIESTEPQTSRSLAEELRRLNMHWAEFVKRNTFDSKAEPGADVQARPQDVQALLKEATLLLKEPLEATAGPLLTYRKRIQFILRKIKEVDLEALTPSPECPADQLQKLKPALLEVMQTLLEAEQVCAELQHSVSGLDSRLAELLHWETEARGLYQLLRAAEQQQRGQDPRAKVLISRGLQLEGQVVTEEQDVQVMVMKSQKNSPIQYLHASAMQDRVRAAVAQSQEAVGMLSSLGARRDRSRSPPEGPPPSKVFIQAKEKPQYMIESDTGHQAQQVETKSVSHPCHETFVPKIVVQEYREKRMTSPPMPYTYAQAVTQIRTKSPPEGQDAALPESAVQIQQQVQGQGLILQQQPPLQEQLQQQTAIEREHQEHKQQLTQEAQQELMPTEPQQQELEQQQHLEIHQDQVQRRVVTQVQVETQVRQTPEHYEQMLPHQQPGRKSPLSSQELKSRKAQAMKNRPWLQKPASGKHKTSAPDAERYSTEGPIQAEPQSDKETVGSVQLVPQHTAAARPLPETQAKVTEQPQQNTQRLHKQEQQQQEQLQHQQQQQKEKHQKQQPQHMEKRPKQKEQLLPQEQQKQPQELLPVLRQTEPHSDTKAESQTTTMMQPHPQTGPKVQNQSQPQTTVYQKSQTVVQVQSTSVSHTTIESLQPAKTMSQTIVSEGQPPSQVLPLPHGLMKTQSLTQSQTQLQLQPQVQTHTQACVPGGPQPSMQPQALGHGPDGAQITPSSPMQAPLQGHIQPPVPSHIQLRSHPQSWAHVRPPSPKPQTHAPVESQSVPQPQTHAQPKIQSQAHVQSVTQGLIHAQPMTHNQPLAQQTQAQFAVQPQIHSQPITQPAVQSGHSQVHAWSQVRTSSPLSIPHPQATTQPPFYPQGYSQGKSPPFQWIPKQESQNQAISQQTHPIPQPYPQQIGQSPQSQAYPAAQPVPQWSQAGSQVGPQLGHPGYSHMGPSYTRPQFQPQVQTQPWAQTQPQVRPHGSMQQQPQMRTYDMFHIQTQQGQVQHQTWAQEPPQIQPQSYSQLQPQPHSQLYSQVQHHPLPQMQASIPTQSQPPHHTHSQPQLQPQLQAQSQAQIQTQPLRKVKPHVQTQQSQLSLQYQQPPHPKHQTQPQTPPKTQSATQPKGELLTQPKPPVQLAPQPEVKTPAQPTVQSPTQPKAESLPQPIHEPLLPLQPMTQAPIKSELPPQPKLQAQTTPLVEAQSPAQPKPQVQLPPQLQAQSPPLPKSQMAPPAEGQVKVQSPTQPKVQTLPQPKPQTQLPPLPQLPAESPPSLQAQTAQQFKAQSPPQARPQTQPLPQSKTQAQSPTQPKCQPSRTILLSQVNVLPQSLAESPDLCITPPALAQAPPQAYTEAYAKAQALARNGFEEAKHCLQEHILEAINVFQDKGISAEQASVKEETLRTLDPELLEEFLRAAKGMEAFCTPSQLRDMEVYTQSVRTQWEAVRAEISGFLPKLRFEVTKKDFNRAALQCEMNLRSRLENQAQACISVDASFAEAGKHLEALKGLCDTLSPEDAHRLAQTQLRECETRLAAIQRQFSGDQDAQLPDSRVPVAFSEDLTVQKEPTRPSDKPQVSTEVFQVTMKTVSVERREVEKQASVEEVTKQDALERYENCKRTLQSQLAKNEQSIMDLPSDSVSLKGLHTRLQEIQFLRQETESLWSEYANQCSQVNGNSGLEQEKAELQEQWRNQQSNLQRRGSSLGTALRQIDSTENHMVDFADRLDRYLRQPKDISGFTLANTNILKDIKDLDDNIQSELDQVSRLDPESSDLDPRDCFPLSRQVETHRTSLDQLRQQVRKSEAAARALDRFLMSLRTVDEDISGVQGAPCSDAQVLQDCRSKLALIRQSIDSLKEKAPQLDLLLQGARLTVTRDGVPASCLDMVTVLLRRLEEADSGLASQQKVIQKETQSKSLGLRKRTLLGELRRLQDAIEMQGLKEPTMPAVQHRLRALSDLEGQLQTQHTELQNLRELQDKQGGGENLFDELETQWKETQKAFSDSKKQCNTLLELLKKFRNCRSHLSNTMQKAEQTISDQASYMGKDNLQRSITKVCHIKEELAGLGERIEEMRGVCRQLQSQLKKFPDCSEALFEAEADTLMDSWLDVTEKTDACMDNLQVGLELWERQLMLGGEVDGWAGAKLALFAESHPFHSEQQVLDMRDEIHTNEENIEHFHKKSVEIQEMLQSQEAPLELQVMETQLRKRMQQVKELFTDCTDVFEELIAVKRHLAEKIEECQSAVENIQGSLSKVDALQPKVEAQIQDLCDDLEAQEEQAEAVLKEVSLVSSVASPQVVEALTVDCSRLREAISRTKDMMHLKREERDKGLLKVIEDERQSFEGWFQDMQVSVNECFENPESKTDVETSLQRLAGFLKSKDAERRLEQLRDQLERGSQQFPPQQLSDFSDWLKEQQKEVGMFTTHCHNRQKQMESLLNDLNSLQKQHDGFRDWLQIKEKRSVESDKVKRLLKDLQDESGRAETLSELLASVRRQGVRAESLLKDGDNLIQRYRNLEARLQREADAQRKLEEELDKFSAEAESARTWITDLLKPLTSTGTETQTEEMKRTAQAVLSSKAEGDSKLNNLRRESERLCECEDLKEDRKQEVQQSVRDTEERWGTALQAAEEALNKAETQAQLDENIDAFRAQNENVQSWIRDQEQNLQSLGGSVQVDEKLEIAKATLSSKPDGDSKLQDLKQRCQSLCDNQGLDESRRQEVQDTVRHTEEQWRKVLTAAEEALNKAETEAETERDFDAFRSQSQNLQSWIKEQKQKLLSHGSQTLFEERLQVAQAVTTSRPEGESKVLDLKRRGESLCELVEESRKAEVQQLVNDAQQQWKTVIQAAGQAELRALSDDFDGQSKNTQSWIRDRQQELQTVGTHTSTEERIHTARNILSSKPEGDCKVNNLRRRGQSLCDHPGADEGRKVHVQQTVRDTEEQWRTVLQAAKQAEDAAGAEITQRTERRKSELREFDALQQDTSSWLTDLQHQLDSLKSQTKAEDRLHSAQTTMSSKPEGDFKLQELRRKVQSLCGQDLEEDKKLQLKVKGAEEQWMRIMQNAKQALDRAERECTLEGQLRDFKALSENTRTWLEDKQQSLDRLDSQTDLEKTINTAQTILSCKPEGDSKLAELSRQSQSLSEQEDLEESVGWEAQRSVEESEEQWGAVLQSAENTLKKAEVQYSLYRELEAFRSQAGSTKTWLRELQQQAESKGSNTQGGRPQLEDRLNTAQAILSSRSSGEAQVTGLKRRAQSLCEQKDLEGDKKQEVEQLVRDAEQQWRTVLKAAEDTQRQLKSVVERLVSCQQQRHQADARLSKLQKRTSNLPCLFQWPGLGERRQAVEQARTLLDEATALAPVLSDVCRQAAELFEITQDQDWSDPSWTAKEESIPALLKELTDAVANLEEGILTERQCTQLLEQHEAAQDWLREHVKGLGAPPADRQGLHSTVNTLKALLQTVNREQREMQELDSARDSLLSLCTPGGRDALTLQVSHLHDLCTTSEQEVRERLTVCETRLGELARRAQGLKERAAALQWELRSLDQALSYSEPQNNIAQLQQHWHSLQNCEKSLEDLGVKVHELNQEVKETPAADELPTEIIAGVESLCQQHDSLQARLSEHQETCSTNTSRCLMDCLHALKDWNHNKPSESSSSVQVTLNKGEKLQDSLQEALSHQQFLTDCLTSVLFEKLEKEASETLREADTHKASLNQSLKELDEMFKQKQPDVLHGNAEETRPSVVAPPRKNKCSAEKNLQKNVPLAEKSVHDEMSVSAELQTETKKLKPTVTVDTKITDVEQITTEPTGEEPQSSTCVSEPFTAPSANEQIKPAVEEPALIQKLIEQSAPAVTEKTTPVPSRRKTKTSATETEPGQTKVAPRKVETIITQGSSRHQSGTAAVEEPKNMDTVSVPVSITEQAATAVVEQAKLGPTGKESQNLNITQIKPAQIKDDAENQSVSPSELLTETDSEHSKSVPKKQKSKTSTTSEPVATQSDIGEYTQLEESKEEPKNGKTSSAAQKTDLVKEPEKSSASEFVSEVTETANLKQSEVLPPKRKSRSPNLPLKQADEQVAKMTEELESQSSPLSFKEKTEGVVIEETKLIPTRRKSKNVEITSTLQQMEPEDNKKEPDSLKSSSTPQVVTEPTVIEKENKLSPIKGTSNISILSLECATKEMTENKQETKNIETISLDISEPGAQAPLIADIVIPARRKSKSLEVLVPESVSPIDKDAGVESKETKQETVNDPATPEFVQDRAEIDVVEQTKFLPPKRKSKNTELPLKLVDTVVPEEPESQSVSDQRESVVTEQTMLVPSRRRSKTSDFSATSQTITHVRSPDVDPEQNKTEPSSQKCSTPDVGTGASQSTVVEKETGKLSPTKRKTKGLKLSPELATKDVTKTIKEPDTQKSLEQSEAVVSEETKLIPTRIKSKRRDVSIPLEPAIGGTGDLDSKEASKELESGSASSIAQVIRAKSETTVVGESDLLPTTSKSKSPNISPERSHKESQAVEKHSKLSQSTEDTVMEETKVIPCRRKSKEGPNSQKPTEITVTPVVEKGKLSPTKRKQKVLKHSPELPKLELLQPREGPDTQELSSTLEVVTDTTEVTVVGNDQLSPTKRESDDVKPSPELGDTELRKAEEEPESEKPSSIPEVATGPTEITETPVEEKGKLSPTERKSKGLKLSPELPTTELTQSKEGPDTQTPSSAPRVITETTECSVIDKGTLSPTKRQQTESAVMEEAKVIPTRREPKSEESPNAPEKASTLKRNTDETLTEHESVKSSVTPDSAQAEPSEPLITSVLTMAKPPHSELDEPKDRCEEEQVITQSVEKVSSQVPHPQTPEKSSLADYIDKLLKSTDEFQKRYLVLDLPETGVSQTYEMKQEAETVVESEAAQSAFADLAVVQPHKAETEFSEISLSEQDRVTLSEAVSELTCLETTQERPKDVREHGVKEERDLHQSSIQCKTEPQSKDMTGNDIQREKVRVKMTRLEVEESMSQCQDNVAKSDSTQPGTAVFTAVEPSETDTISLQISISEQETVKPSQSLEIFKTTQETPREVKEEHGKVLTGINDEPKYLDDKPLQKIHMGPEVCILQLDIQAGPEEDNAAITSAEGINSVQTSMQSKRVPENKGITTAEVTLEKAAVTETMMKVQESSALGQDSVPERDSTQLTSPDYESLQPHVTEFIEISIYEQDIEIPSQTGTRIELLKTASTQVKEHGVQEEYPKVSTHDMHEEVTESKDLTFADVYPEKDTVKMKTEEHDLQNQDSTLTHDMDGAPKSLNEKSVIMEKLHKEADVETLQLNTPTFQVEEENISAMTAKAPSIQCENVPGNKDRTTADLQPESVHDAEMSPSDMHDVPKSLDESSVKKGEMVQDPVPLTTTAVEGRLQSMDLSQAVQKSSTDIFLDNVSLVEGLPSQENKAQPEESVVKTEDHVIELPESTMGNIFTEVQLLAGTGPNSQLIKGKLLEDAPEALITSTGDLDNRLSRLTCKVLSCKNQPAVLSPTAMAQQLEEAQECRNTARAQVSLLSHLRGANTENREALELVKDKWCTAVQDAAAVIQSKEAQLQVVTDYCRQTQEAKTKLERLTADLNAVRMSPVESSLKETERLCSLQRSIEENRTVLGEMLVTHTKLSPHLSRSERAAAQTELRSLQEKWSGLEGDVDRMLYYTNVHSHETSSLLSTISSLQEHLETIGKDLEAKSPSATQWNCKKAQELMVANAEVKAAQQTLLHLHQLSEALLLSSQWEKEIKEIQQGLQKVKDQLSHIEELVSSHTQSSSNPIMEKMLVVMRDGLAWAKQTETDIEGRRKRVALLPEDVHRQFRDLKKLQFEVMAKQGQLESLVEEVTELLPQLDQAEEVPMVRSSLEFLEELSKSTTEKLTKAVREIESGLQTREKLTEQIADLDSWVVTHLIREVSKSEDDELRSPADLDRRVRQIQETLAEAEKQAAVCEALLMESKDIASELSIAENCQLFNKLTNLQEDIRAISSYEKANKKELDELTQTVDSCMKNLATVEKSFRSMLVDLDRHRFPITREFLQDLEPFKHMILDHKSQVDLLQPWIPQEETRELYSIISELESKMATLEMKSTDHERYLYMRQCVEDLMENIQEQVHQTKEDSKELEEKYKLCQTLTVQLPLIKNLSEETHSKLQMISADLYPSQLSAEQRRLKQNEVTLDMLEITLYNNLSIVEWNLLKELDLKAEKAAAQAFLTKTQQELQKVPVLETNETVIKNEYWRIMILKKTVESRMRAVEVLEQNKGTRRGSGSQNLMDLKNAVLSECDSQMENISEARKCLRSYTCAVRQAVQFLRDIEVSLLPPQGSAGLCSERLEETQQALASLQHHFQTHVEQLQSQDTLHPYLSPQTVEQLQERILSQLLVRMSTLQAMGHIRLDCLSRCAENHRKYSKCQDEIIQIVMSVERSLLQVLCQKVTCLTDCIDQHAKLNDLYEEVESLQKPLKELKEWCPEQSCCGGREAVVTAVWKRLARLLRCTRELTARSKQRVAEWGEITNSVEKASVVLEEVETELPDHSGEKASTEELQDLLQSWEQNQDRLDCEHRALSALELRTARLLGVPAHLEQAPPTPLCQQLQAMQARYDSVKERSREGLEAARTELEEREKIREELHGIQVWLEAADGLLSEMEQSSSTEELQEVHSQLFTQKASLQRIMESLKMKYSDMYMLVPVDIEGQLQEVTQSLQQTGVKVGEVVQRSGPVHRLGAKLCEIQAGLSSVQKRLEQKSPTVTQAKLTQKCVWDKLDMWHSCLAALEVDMQDLEPEEVLTLTERLVEVQQLHSQLAKQAEQRTTLISKIRTWLQQHQEMINSSTSWMAEAQSWLAAPCTYTTAKCLSSHVQALQTVLDDSAQIRSTLQGFSSVLNEMSQVCDVTTLQQQLVEADREVASVQDSFTAPLSQLEHAAAEVEAIESEVRRMENDVAEIKTLLTSPESFPSPREESLKIVEQRIQSMRRTIAEIQKCKPGLCLPDKADESLTVFTVVDQLQNLLLELEKKVPALFIQQPPTPIQAKAPSAQQATSQPQLIKSTSVEAEKDDVEQVQIRIAHVEADVLKRTGATLLTVQRSSPEQRQSWTPDSTQRERQDVLRAEEARESRGSEEQRVEEGEEGVLWWLWEAFLGIYPEEPVVVVPEETKAASGQNIEWTGGNTQDVEGPTDTTAASSPEALSKPLGTVRTQSLPESMVNTTSKFDSEAQQKCVVS